MTINDTHKGADGVNGSTNGTIIHQAIYNHPAPGISYFTPIQVPPSGTAIDKNRKPVDDDSIPSLFRPYKIKNVQFQNKIIVSPMCQYSADQKTSEPNDWHLAHLGGIISRGPGLTIIEATAVTPNGRISPNDLGLWNDSQIPAFKRLTEFAHGQGQKIGIQIAHGGRKANTVAPFLHPAALAVEEAGGWPDNVVGPMGGVEGRWDPVHATPKALTEEDIAVYVQAFKDTAIRSVKAGFDVIEIHGAHGYLIHEFLSPAVNKRTDKYGGSFENRIRLVLEIVDAILEAIPKETPLFIRISATDWLEYKYSTPEEASQNSWTVDQTIELAKILRARGVDLFDVSSGGNHPEQRIPHGDINFQTSLAKRVKEALDKIPSEKKMLIGAVGGIKTGVHAQQLLDEGYADVIFTGREFQRNPALVWNWADELKVDTKAAGQIEWGIKGFRKNK